ESIAVRQDQPAAAPVPATVPDVKVPSPAESDARVPPPQPVRQRERDRVLFPPPGMVAAASVPVETDPAVTLESLPDSAVGTADAKTPEPPIVVPRIAVTPISVPPIVITPIPRSR
ncbi:MAG TPA: hypothetical protein VFS23_26030, partial [Vicinamibacterales bacterium]|nr:hypothetical protein [Vicinamibacterales bacterium]